jgi:hypothetical protein
MIYQNESWKRKEKYFVLNDFQKGKRKTNQSF